MKLLLVAEKEITRSVLTGHLKPRGFDIISYRNPIKAMDNIDEIEPDLVVFSAEDFPRHWKPFIQLLRQDRSAEQTAFVLLTGTSFDFDEAAKAKHLEVSGIISEAIEDRNELRKLEDIVTRYSALRDNRNDLRYIPSEGEHIEFILTHPVNHQLITGVLFDLSPTGAAFIPDDPKVCADMPAGSTIPHCSIKIDDRSLTFACRIVRNSGRLALKFIEPSSELERAIIDFADRRAERDLELLLQVKN